MTVAAGQGVISLPFARFNCREFRRSGHSS